MDRRTRVVRDVGGVPGLMLATGVFSEAVERRLWNSRALFRTDPPCLGDPREPAKRLGITTGYGRNDGKNYENRLAEWPDDVFKVINAVRDCGLYEELIDPDMCYCNSYPLGVGFKKHRDSIYRWGETVVGVTLGAPCTMVFSKGEHGAEIDVHLPRRSIYIMSGDSRKWHHGVRRQTANRLHSLGGAAPWSGEMRRSLTLRTTKVLSDLLIERQMEGCKEGSAEREALEKRAEEQAKYTAQEAGPRAEPAGKLAQMRSEAKERAAFIDMLPTHLRFAAGERCYAGCDEEWACKICTLRSPTTVRDCPVCTWSPADSRETPPPQKRARRREQCPFGHGCYRQRNPHHMRELAHPGDADWLDPTVGGSGVIDLSTDD